MGRLPRLIAAGRQRVEAQRQRPAVDRPVVPGGLPHGDRPLTGFPALLRRKAPAPVRQPVRVRRRPGCPRGQPESAPIAHLRQPAGCSPTNKRTDHVNPIQSSPVTDHHHLGRRMCAVAARWPDRRGRAASGRNGRFRRLQLAQRAGPEPHCAVHRRKRLRLSDRRRFRRHAAAVPRTAAG